MIQVFKVVKDMLSNDQTLAGLVSSYEGQPAIFLSWAPGDAKYPYVLLNGPSCVPDESRATDRMVLAVDAFDGETESAVRVLQIAQRVERVLDGARPAFQDLPSLGIRRRFRDMVVEEPGVYHVHIEFTVRFGRKDLFV